MKNGKMMLSWDYNFSKYASSNNCIQFDWNQTLITKLNKFRAKTCHTSECIILLVPNKFKSIIESLYYYNQIDNMISNLYLVKFINSDEDYITFGDLGHLIIKNFNK